MPLCCAAEMVGFPVHAACSTRRTVRTPCRLQIPSVAGDRAYYSFEPHSAWRFIVLDTFDIAVIGNHPQSEEFKEAWEMLADHVNVCSVFVQCCCVADGSTSEPPEVPRIMQSPDVCVYGSDDVPDLHRRWKPHNGAVGKAQLEWVRAELNAAKASGQRALVFAHCPIHPPTVGKRVSSLLWNFDEC
jgi:manganese-dependent ADP-ribose/CDP-alcohol diphosphatase